MPKMVDDDFDESAMFNHAMHDVLAAKPVTTNSNPLAKYFRLPGLSIKLPTNGVFFPEGGIELDDAGEVTVLPMRGADELLLSSPDALMNNTAITSLVSSCVPAIKMPQHLSAPDLDAILIAIRVASNGETMELELPCPKCEGENRFEINLPAVLSTMTTIPEQNPIRLSDDVVVYLRPHEVAVQTKILVSVFKETRAAQALDANPDLDDEEKTAKLGEVMKRLNDMNLFGVINSIIKVVVPGAEVTQFEYIKEFIDNTDKATLNKIRSGLEKINSMGVDKSIPVQCTHCAHEWTTSIEFNPATFFEDRSSD